jgi:hypothetical protein
MIHDERVYRAFARLQFEAELLLDGSEDGVAGRGVIRLRGPVEIGGPFELASLNSSFEPIPFEIAVRIAA